MKAYLVGSMVAAVMLGAFAVGCAEGAPPKKNPTYDPSLDDTRSDPSGEVKASSSSSSSGSPSAEGPLSPEDDKDAPGDRTDPDDQTPTDPTNPDPTDPPANPDPPAAQKATCTSTTEGHKSIAEATYTIANGAVKISSLTIAITNKDNRNKNDIDFWVTPPGGSEKLGFNSGDILPSGKTTPVPIPGSVSIATGAKVRVETNFDTSFNDPHASCNLQF